MKNNSIRIDELAKKVKKGDKKAFEELYKLTSSRAYFTALQICGDNQEAEDIVQESYITALNKISSLERTESFMGWFNRIVVNKSKDFLKKKNPKLLSEEEEWILQGQADEKLEFSPEENIDKEELKSVVMDAVKELNVEKRTCVMMKYFNDMSVNEIAQAMEVPVSTVKNRLFDARKELKFLFEKKGTTAAYSIAPFGVVGWAYNAAFENIAQSFEGSAAAAKIFSGIAVAGTAASAATAGTAVTGTGLFAKAAAATTMQKVAAGLVVAGVVTGSTIGITSVVNNKKEYDDVLTTSYSETVEDASIPEEKNSFINVIQPASPEEEKEHDEKVLDFNIPGEMPHKVVYKGTMKTGKKHITFEESTDSYYVDFEAAESGYYLFDSDCVDGYNTLSVALPDNTQGESINALSYDEVNIRNGIQIYYVEKGVNTVLVFSPPDTDSMNIDVEYLGEDIAEIVINQEDLDNVVLGYNEYLDDGNIVSQNQIMGEGIYSNFFRTKLIFSSGKVYDMGDTQLIYTVREGELKEGSNTAVFNIFGKEIEREITVKPITDYVMDIQINNLEQFTFAKINEYGFVYEAPENYEITVTYGDGSKETFNGTTWDKTLKFDGGVELRVDMFTTGLRDREPLRFVVAIGEQIYIDRVCVVNEFDAVGYRKALDRNNLETAKEYKEFIGEFYERAENSGDTTTERIDFTAEAVKSSAHYSLKLVKKIAGFELDYAITIYKIMTENEFDLLN